jgi:hypothetical protein
VHPLWWYAVGVALVSFDYLAGAETQFPVFYVIPVTLAAWYSGRWPALALAVGLPLFHVMLLMTGVQESGDPASASAATMLRAAVIIVMALWFARLAEHERQLHRYVQTLEGLLPICSFCKSIRNESGHWEVLEDYISARSGADFTHGLCPSCLHEHYSVG